MIASLSVIKIIHGIVLDLIDITIVEVLKFHILVGLSVTITTLADSSTSINNTMSICS